MTATRSIPQHELLMCVVNNGIVVTIPPTMPRCVYERLADAYRLLDGVGTVSIDFIDDDTVIIVEPANHFFAPTDIANSVFKVNMAIKDAADHRGYRVTVAQGTANSSTKRWGRHVRYDYEVWVVRTIQSLTWYQESNLAASESFRLATGIEHAIIRMDGTELTIPVSSWTRSVAELEALVAQYLWGKQFVYLVGERLSDETRPQPSFQYQRDNSPGIDDNIVIFDTTGTELMSELIARLRPIVGVATIVQATSYRLIFVVENDHVTIDEVLPDIQECFEHFSRQRAEDMTS